MSTNMITVKGDGRILLNGVQHGPKYAYETACSQAKLLATTPLAPGATITYETRIKTKAEIAEESKLLKKQAKDAKKAERDTEKARLAEIDKQNRELKKALRKQERLDAKEKARLAAIPVLPPPPAIMPEVCPIAC